MSFGEAGCTFTRRPAGNGLGGDGSLAPTFEPSEWCFTATTGPAGNGLGGEGSAASLFPPVGKRERGPLSSSSFPSSRVFSPSNAYLGKGLGGDGSVAAVPILTNLCGAEGFLSSSGGNTSTR